MVQGLNFRLGRSKSGNPLGQYLAALLLVLAGFSLSATVPADAQEKIRVPYDWALKPSGLGVGDEFRLLVVTRSTRNAESNNISTYNTFVQQDIDHAFSHALIRPYADKFKAVVSTASTNARSNTATLGTEGCLNLLNCSIPSIPIYWLLGDKVADNYGDFYDGTWDSETPRTAKGTLASTTPTGSTNIPCHNYWTGSDDAGNAAAGGLGSGTYDRLGYLSSSYPIICGGGGDRNPLSSRDTRNDQNFRFYALSPVFKVARTVSLQSNSAVQGNSYNEDWKGSLFRQGIYLGVPFNIVTNPSPQRAVKVKVRIMDEHATDLVNEETRTVTSNIRLNTQFYSPKTDPLRSIDGSVSMEIIEAPSDVLVTDGRLVYTVKNTIGPPTITISAHATVLAGVNEGGRIQFSLNTDADDGFAGGQDVNVRVTSDPPSLIDPSDRIRSFRASGDSASQTFTLQPLLDPGNEDGTVTIELLAGEGYDIGTASKIEIPVKNEPVYSGRLLEAVGGTVLEGRDLPFTLSWPKEFQVQGSITPSVKVSVAPTGGEGCKATASADDFTFQTKTIHFLTTAAGTQGQNITESFNVSTTNDNYHERDETVCLKIHEPRYLVLPGNRKDIYVSGTIRDNDPLPTISVSSPQASESTDELIFEVTLDKPPHEKDLTVAYSDSGRGTATSGKDHDSITAGTLTFSRLPIDDEGTRDTRKTVVVPLINDKEQEGDETVVLRFNKVRNGKFGDGGRNLYATGTITDDERDLPTLEISDGSDAAVQEGEKIRISVDLRDSKGKLTTHGKDIEFIWSTQPFLTTAGIDYTTVDKARATLPAGKTGVEIEIQTLDDSIDEAVEYIRVYIDGVVESIKGDVRVSSISQLVPIYDGPTLAILDAGKRTEGQPLEFRVTLGVAAPTDVEVGWKTETRMGQTATAGKDYTAASGTLIIPAGKTGGLVRVQTLDDSLDEPDEDLSVKLTSFPSNVDWDYNYAAKLGIATGIIRDNDARPRITMTDVSVNEGGKMTFKIVLDKVSGKHTNLGWATVPSGSHGATFGKDYHGKQSGQITINPGGKEASIEFTTIDDSLDEPDETFMVRLYDRDAIPNINTNSAFASQQRATQTQNAVSLLDATGTIVDNDGTTLSIHDAKPVNEQGGATARFRITLSHAQTTPVTVTVASADGNNDAPIGAVKTTNAKASTLLVKGDYEPIPARTLTFTPGETVKTLDVTINDDLVGQPNIENTETFRMLLSDANGATISRGTAIGTIQDSGGIRYSIVNQKRLVREGESITVRVRRDRADVDSGRIRVCLQATGTGTGHAVIDWGGGVPAGGEDVHLASRNLEGSLCTVRTESHDVKYIEFKKGQFETSFQVHTIGDTLNEGDETFLVTENSVYLRQSATDAHLFPKMFTIVDNDFGVLRVEATNSPYEGQQAEFEIYVDDPAMIATGGTNIHVTTSDGTATAGDDYEAQNRKTVSLTRPASADDPAATFTVDTVDDEDFEVDEIFSVMLGGLPNSLRLHPVLGTATTTIRDEDGNRVHLENAVVDEGDRAAIKVRMELPVEKTVTVSWKTVAGTAVPVDDFTAVPTGRVRIAPGSTTATIHVATVEDTVREEDESFSVVVTGTDYVEALVGRPGNVVIRNDDTGLIISGFVDASVDEGISWTSAKPSFEGLAEGDVLWTVEGDDAAEFTIDSDTGQLTLAAKNFENPADKDKDNIYEAIVRVTDEDGNTGSQAVSVAVNDVVLGYIYVNLDKIRTKQGIHPKVSVDQASGRIQAEEGANLNANFLYGDRGLGSGPQFTYKPKPAHAPEFGGVDCKVSGLGGEGTASADDISGVNCFLRTRWEVNGGFSRGTINGRLVQDNVAEGTETFSIDLSTNHEDLLVALWTGSRHVLSSSIVIDITDNPGITLSKTAFTIAEGTGSDTYDITLDSQPSHEVTVTITAPAGTKVNKTGGDAGTSQALTFSPTAAATLWSKPQTVTVTADANTDDNPSGRTADITHAAASTDPAYNAIAIDDLEVTITDDNATTVTLATPDATATEGDDDEKATITLTLGRGLVKGETLAVPLAFAGGTIGTHFTIACPASLPTGITCQNIATAPQVTFTGPDTGTTATALTLDFTAKDDAGSAGETVTVSIPATSTGNAPKLIATGLEGGATGTRTGNGQIAITDDDDGSEGVTLSKTAFTIAEGTGSDTYDITLDSQPSHEVTVTITAPAGTKVNKTGGDAGTSQALTFSPTAAATLWSKPQTVTVTADANTDDNPSGRTADITHAAASTDPAYNAIAIDDLEVTITDDNATTVTLATPDATATEGDDDEKATITLTLGRGLVKGETLAVPLAFAGGTIGTHFTIACPASLPTGITCQNIATAPQVTFTGPDTGTTATALTLDFTAKDDAGSAGETVTVSIPATSTGNAPKLIATGLEGGATGTRTGNGQIAITDDDDGSEGVTLSKTAFTIAEGTGSDTYDITLDSQPSHEVTVTITAPAGTKVNKTGGDAGTSQALTFSPTAAATLWSKPQTVTVTADANTDDNPSGRTADITHAAASTDPAYNAIAIDDLEVTITDDNATTVTLATPDATATEGDDDEKATITLTLGRGLVKGETLAVPLAFAGGTIGTHFTIACPASLPTGITCQNIATAPQVTFTGPDTGTTATALTLDFTAKDDAGSAGETVTVSIPATSTGNAPKLIATGLEGGATGTRTGNGQIAITDDDDGSEGVTLSKTAFTIAEGTGSDTYDITLDSQPSHEVTVTITAPAGTKVNKTGGDAGTSQALTFSPTAAATLWSKPQTVTVTADANTDDNPSGRTADITHAAASTDPAYNAIAIDDLEVTITDDNATTVTLATPDATATEGDDDEKATITLTLGRGLVKGETLAVPLAFAGGTIGTHFTIACPASLPTGITCQNIATAPQVTFTGPDTGTTATALTLDFTAKDDAGSAGETVTVSIPATSTGNAPKLIATGLEGGATGTRTGNGQIAITDDDDGSEGVTLSKTAFTIAEGTGSDTYDITLDSQPSHEVTVTITAPAGTKVNKTGGDAGTSQALTFSPTAAATLWSKPQTVTVTADANTDDNPSGRTADITHAAASTDPAYNAIAIDDLEVTITDDNATTVTLATPDATATEGDDDEKATITLTLGRGLVKGETLAVPLAFAGGTIGTHFTIACPASLPTGITCQNIATAPQVTFTGPDTGTTATALTLDFTAKDDAGSAGETVTVSIPATSTGNAPKLIATGLEGGATGTRTGNGQIAITDDDDGSEGVTLSKTAFTIAEGTGSDTYDITLDSQPSHEVTVTITAPAGTKVNKTGGDAGTSQALTFSPTAAATLWSKPQTVTVTADANTDDNPSGRTADITHAAASTDPAYNAIAIDDLEVTITDDNATTVTLATPDATATEGDDDEKATITLTLGRGLVKGETLAVPLAFAGGTIGTHFTIACPASLPTGITCQNIATAPQVTFTGPDTGTTATALTLDFTAKDDAGSAGETVTVSIPATSTGNAPKLIATGLEGGATGTRTGNGQIAITDDDDGSEGVTLSKTAFTIAEGTGSDTYDITLDSQPSHEVTVTITAPAGTKVNKTGGDAGTSQALTFSPTAAATLWSKPQTVTVTADANTDDNPSGRTADITHAAASTDPAYNAIAIDDLEVTITDDNATTVTLATPDATATEGDDDEKATITLTLGRGLVKGETLAVPLAFAGGTIGTHFTIACPASLPTGITCQNIATAPQVTFTGPDTGTTATALTLDFTAKDDAGSAGETVTVSIPATSTGNAPKLIATGLEGGATGTRTGNGQIAITDDDDGSEGVTLSKTAFTIAEGTGSDTYDITLDSQPSHEVTVTITAPAGTKVNKTGGDAGTSQALTFSPTAAATLWSKPQTVTVTADANTDDNPSGRTADITHAAASTDPAYNAIAIDDLEVTITDDNATTVTLATPDATATEGDDDEKATITLTLGRGLVKGETLAVPLAFAGGTIGTHFTIACPASLPTGITCQNIATAPQVTFTGPDTGTTATALTLDFTAKDDAGSAGETVTVSIPATSTGNAPKLIATGLEGGATGTRTGNGQIAITDDDDGSEGVTLSKTAFTIAEGTGSDTYDITLDSQPSHEVTVTITAPAGTKVNKTGGDAGTSQALTFSPTAAATLWSKPQTVTVTADANTDDNPSGRTADITHAAASTDPAYNAIAIDDLEVTITDDNATTVTLATPDATATEGDDDEKATITLTLGRGLVKGETLAVPLAFAGGTIGTHFTIACPASLPTGITCQNIATAPQVTFTGPDTGTTATALTLDFTAKDDAGSAGETVTVSIPATSTGNAPKLIATGLEGGATGTRTGNGQIAITDDDDGSEGVTLSKTAFTIAEGTGSDTYDITLDSQPSHEVTVTITAPAGTKVNKTGGDAGTSQALTFSPTAAATLWSKPQTVTVTADANTDDNPSGRTADITHAAASTDPAYNAIAIDDLEVTITDDNATTVTLATPDATATEGDDDEKATITLTLGRGLVKGETLAVPLAFAGGTIGTHFTIACPASLPTGITCQNIATAPQVTFTGPDTGTTATALTLDFTAKDDAGSAGETVTVSIPATSTGNAPKLIATGLEGGATGTRTGNGQIAITDDDDGSEGVTLSKTAFTIAEGTGSDTYDITLDSQPSHEVTVTITAPAGTKVNKTGGDAGTSQALTFSPTAAATLWSKPQTVTVTADANTDDNPSGRTADITHAAASTDPAYNAIAIDDLEVTITDDNATTVTLATPDATATEGDDDEKATITLTLGRGLVKGETLAVPLAFAGGTIGTHFTIACPASLPTGITCQNIATAPQVTFTGPDTGTTATALTLDFTAKDDAGSAGETVTVSIPATSTGNAPKLIATGLEGGATGTRTGNGQIAITDDDDGSEGVTLSKTAFTIAEGTGSDTYDITLDSQPSHEVTVTITAPAGTKVNKTGGDAGTSQALTFSPTAAATLWSKPQTVTVTADANTDDNPSGRTADITHAAASTDPAYNAIAIDDLEVTITDDNATTVTLATPDATATEGDDDEKATITLTLGRGLVKGETLAVPLAFAGGTIGTHFTIACPASLPTGITCQNIATAPQVTFTGPDTGTTATALTLDFTAKDDAGSAGETVTVSIPATSTGNAPKLIATGLEGGATGTRTGNGQIAITDDDDGSEGVTLSKTAFTIAEGTGSDTYDITLDSQPSHEVTVTITAPAGTKVNKTGGDAGTSQALTFSPTAAATLWSKPQTVTVTADANTDDNPSGRTADITHAAASTDPAYNAIAIDDLEVTITDDNATTVTLATPDATATEGDDDEKATITLTLGRGLVKGETLAVPLAFAGGTIGTHFTIACPASLPTGITCQNIATAPQVTFTGPDTGTTATALTLDFTAKDDAGSAGETVTVSIPATSTGNAPKLIATGLEGGATGTRTGNGQIAITDDDDGSEGVTLSKTAFTIAEGTGSDTYDITLDSQPSHEVTVTITAPAGTKVNKTGGDAGTSQALTFSPTAAATLWSKPQTVTVTADANTDDNPSGRTADITHAAASTDPAYNAIAIDDLEVTITDDNATTVTLATPDATATEGDDDEKATITLTLGRGLVKGETLAVPLAFAGGTIGTHFTIACPASLPTGITCQNIATAPQVTFTGPDTGTTATALTLDFTAKDDAGSAGETVTVSIPATSTGNAPKLIATGLEGGATGTRTGNGQIAITDDDDGSEGVTLSKTAFTIAEGTGSDTYDITLDSQPSHEVTVTITAPAGTKVNKTGGDAGTSQALTFSPTAAATLWSKPQTVTVTADANTDDNPSGRTADITHAAASTDPAYNAIAIDDLEVTITDDNATTVTLATPDATATEGDDDEKATITLTLGRGLVKGETLAVPLAFAGGTIGTHFTIACPASLPTGITCQNIATAPQVTFTGPDTGTTATALTLDFTAKDDAGSAGETVTVSIPATSTGNAPKLIATGLEGGATGTRTGNGQIAITDDDDGSEGVTLSKTAFTIAEGTGSDTYDITLDSQPSHEVTVTITAPAGTKVNKTGGDAGTSQALTFSPTAAATLWSKPQTVTVTADANTDDNPSGRTADITHAAASTDPAYNAIAIDDLEVTITDDNATTVTLATPDATATEGDDDEKATITLTLGRGLVKGETLAVPLAFAGGTIGTHFTIACPASLPTGITCQNIATAPQVTFTGPDTGTTATALTLDFTAKDDAGSAGETVTVSIPATSTGNAPKLIATGLEGGATGTRTGNGQIAITDDDDGSEGVTLSKTAFTIAEGTGSDTYDITLDSQPSHEVTVTITAPAGTKVNKTGGDAGTSQALTFSPTAAATLWSKPQTVTVTADANTDDNPSGRTADITHAAASTDPAYNAIAIDDLEVTITDDNATTVTLATPDATATEGDDDEKATITLTLGRGLVKGETLAVPLAFAGGTIGTHFTIACPASLPTGITCQNIATAPQVTFTGPDTGTTATALTLDFTAKDDAGSAGETVTVSIPATSTGNAPKLIATGLEGGATGTRTGNGQIAITDDDDGSEGVTVSPTSLNLQEIDDSSTTGTTENVGTYTIKFDTQPTANVVINMTVPAGAPFSINPTSLTFTPSGTGIWSTAQTVTVTATDDNIDNAGNQRQAIITHTLIPGSSNYTGVTVDNVTVIVTDDDEPASFSIADASAAEGEVITFAVNRSGATGEPASLSWSTSDDGDGAHPASTGDYTPQTTAQTLSFAAGDTSKTITVQTTQDQIDEENETFLVTLSQPSAGASISDGTAIGTITDNDDTPTGITLSVDADTKTDNVQNSLTENGGDRTVRVTATVKGGSTFPEAQVITIEIGQPTDSATEGADYATIADKTITIPAGTTSAHVDFTLAPVNDNLDELDEIITISGTTTGGISITGTTITLNDDDTRGVSVTPTSLTLLETDDASTTESTENVGTYAIRLDTRPTGNVVINMTVPDGAPFSINPTSLTFTPTGTGIWSTEQTVTVTATNDDIDNTGDQRQAVITHTIAAGSADYSGASVANVSITVNDDDIPMVSYTLVSLEVVESDAVYPIIVTIEPPSATDFMVGFQLSGTAQEGSDHKMEREVMIPAGESPVETQIEILDDDIIEDDETVIMALMTSPSYEYEPNNPSNTALQTMTIIDDDSQSGNPDPIAAWQTRFGRAVAEHALEGISNRIEAPRHAQTLVELAGYPLDLNPTGATSTLESTPTGYENINSGDPADRSFGPGNNQAEQNTMTLQEAFLRSSFMTTEHNDSTQESHAYWGQVSQSFFQGSEGELSFDGETTTAMLGADRTKGKWLVGLAVLQSTGKGTYHLADEPGNIEASLTAIVPYTSLAASERLRIWSALGYGNGWIAHSSEPGLTQKADMSWSLAAIGFRGSLLRATEVGDLELAVVGDAFWTAIKSEKTNDFGGASGEVTKFRLGLEGTKEIALKDNRYLTPRFNVSLRRDGGDAETGWGIEVSGGVNWQDTASGLAVDLSGWKLVTHASNGFSDWGYSFSVTYDPNPYSKRGLSANYSQTVNGQPNDIFNTLQQTDQFGGEEIGDISRQAEVSYGFPAFDGQYTSSPYIVVNESGYSRDLTLGGRLSREHGSPDLDVGVMGRRSESNGSVPDYSVGLDLRTRW